MTRDDKRPRQPRLTDGEREKARRAKRRKQRQDDHRLKAAADPENLAEEWQDREKWSMCSGKKPKAGQRRKNEGWRDEQGKSTTEGIEGQQRQEVSPDARQSQPAAVGSWRNGAGKQGQHGGRGKGRRGPGNRKAS